MTPLKMATPVQRSSWALTWRGALLVIALVATLGVGFVNKGDWLRYVESTHAIEHTYQVLATVDGLRHSIRDAESGERGYLLTGEPRYLVQYRAALSSIPLIRDNLRSLTADNRQQQARLVTLDQAIAAKLSVLQETIELRRDHGLEWALGVIRTGRGQTAMDDVWRITGDVQELEKRLLVQRSALAEARVTGSRKLNGLGGLALITLLVMTTIAIERDTRKRRRAEEALRDSEEQFRQVFEESPSGILLIEEDLRIRHANPALCRLLGYDNSELRQLTLPAILPQDSASDVTRRRVDQRYRTKSGEAVWVNVNETVIRNSQGGVMYNLALVEDITARRKADQEILAMKGSLERSVEQRTAELAETNRRLESSNKELESFAYSVSHDLRAPLRSIDSFSQIILEEYADRLDAEGAQFLGRIRAGAKTMSQLIDDLLNLSRLSRGELRRESVHLSSIVSGIVSDWRGREPWRVIDAEIAPDVRAGCDARLLRIALENLLGNAWKFTSKLEKAHVEFGSVSQQGDTVYFVRDNGAGFDMAYASQLFGPFQRLHQATEFEGTGIGLATVQRIVHRHGGRVWAESAVGRGATFYFTLVGEAG